MKRNGWALTALALLLSSAMLASCASAGPMVVREKEIGSPADHTLVYGYLAYHGPFGTKALGNARFIQVQPDKAPGGVYAIRPLGDSGHFFIPPRPTGSSWRFIEYMEQSGNTIYIYKQGLSGKRDFDPRLEKPGLMYVGAHAWHRTFTMDGDKKIWGAWELGPVSDEGYELETLRAMAKQYRGTEWEALILERMKELGA